MEKEPETIEIDIIKLQRIAEYYEFPFAVFLAPISAFEGTTRREKRYQALQRMIDEYVEQ